jgi:hypothetical protein
MLNVSGSLKFKSVALRGVNSRKAGLKVKNSSAGLARKVPEVLCRLMAHLP